MSTHEQFGQQLWAATARRSSDAVREVLEPVLRAAPTIDDRGVASLSRVVMEAVAQRIDAESASPERYVALAADLGALLREMSADEALELADIVVERHRTSKVVEKHVSGIISRTAFLSFVAEQQWPERIKQNVLALSSGDLKRLTFALSEANLRALRMLLLDGESWRSPDA